MRFGPDAQTCSYFLDGSKLTITDKVEDLGIIIDHNLKFDEHCAELNRKCNFICYSIIKLFRKRSPEEYFKLFKLYVRPIMEYNICFWFPTPAKYVNIIENIQRKFTRRICPMGLSYTQRLEQLSDSTVRDRFLQFSCHLMYKALHNILQIDHTFAFSLLSATRRNSQKLLIPFSKLSVRKSFCTIRSIKLWNSLPESVVSSPNFHSFKRALVPDTPELRA